MCVIRVYVCVYVHMYGYVEHVYMYVCECGSMVMMFLCKEDCFADFDDDL